MKLKLGAMTLLCTLAPLHFAPAQNAARAGTIASEKLEKLISDYEGASGYTRYVLLQRIAGDGSPRAIDFLLGICRDEAARDRIDTISLTAPLLTNHASVKTAFVELLDDPGVVEEVVFHLVSTLEPDLLKEVARRWPIENAPAWAFRASSVIYHFDNPEIAELFRPRLEHESFHPRWRYDLRFEWYRIPPVYRTYLHDAIKKRPLDTRGLVYAATYGAAQVADPAGLDFVCDAIVDDAHVYGWQEMQILLKTLELNPSLAPPDPEKADYLADASVPVVVNQGRWFILRDGGHPAADGTFAIVVVDAQTKRTIKLIRRDGQRYIPVRKIKESEIKGGTQRDNSSVIIDLCWGKH